jgi:predicted dehydrogenase
MAPERIAQFLPQVVECGVTLVENPREMLGQIDAVLILSLCGAAHVQHAQMFLSAGIPVFVDKPFATNWTDAVAMTRLSAETGVQLWHASAMRYTEEMLSLQARLTTLGLVQGVISYGPGWLAEGNPGLLHYGIHATEQLFALLGPGCQRITNVATANSEVVTGEWSDGRLGTVRVGRSGHTGYGLSVFAQSGVLTEHTSTRFAYRNLCQQIVTAFQTQVAPVSLAETLEVMQFLLAANLSRQRGGVPVSFSEIAC